MCDCIQKSKTPADASGNYNYIFECTTDNGEEKTIELTASGNESQAKMLAELECSDKKIKASYHDDDVVLDDSCVGKYTNSWQGHYKDSSGNVYKICKDKDGYTIIEEDGSRHTDGVGSSWTDVKTSYGIEGVKPFKCKQDIDCDQ